jgi:hypothetical protein
MRPDPQTLLEWIKLGAPTDDELECMNLLQPECGVKKMLRKIQ